MGKFVVKETKTGFVFNLKAGNGEVIAVSEVYSSEISQQSPTSSSPANRQRSTVASV